MSAPQRAINRMEVSPQSTLHINQPSEGALQHPWSLIDSFDPLVTYENFAPESTRGSRIAAFSKLNSMLFQAAKDPHRWSAALHVIKSFFDAEFVLLTWHGRREFPGRFTLVSPIVPDPIRREYAEIYLEGDPLSQVSPGVFRTTDEPDLSCHWRRFYEIYGSRYDCHHGLAAGFATQTQERFTFRLFRRKGAPHFVSEDREYFQAVVVQLAEAVGWQRDWISMQADKNSFATALDDLSVPTLVVDALGRVSSATRSARRLLEDPAGPAHFQDHRLQMRQTPDQSLLLKTLEKARTHPTGMAAMQCMMLDSAQRWTLVVRAVPGLNGDRGTPTWMLMWRNVHEKAVLDADLLRGVFQLTPTEINLAKTLVSGGTLLEACSDLDIRASTARVHLRAIFRKTAVQRQIDLVQLLSHFCRPTAV